MSRMVGQREPTRDTETATSVALSRDPVSRFARLAAVTFLGLLILVNVVVLAFHLTAPHVEVTLTPDGINSDGGFAFLAPLDVPVRFPYRLSSDDVPGGLSRLVLREDGRPLGPAHVLHQEIRDLGGGRYSHWGAMVHFSASDNSDPRRNGRSYTATDREVVSPRLVSILLGADLIAGAALAGLGAVVGLPLAARNRKRVAQAMADTWRARARPIPVVITLLLVLALANVAVLVFHLTAPAIEVTLAPDGINSDGGFAFLAPFDVPVRFPYRLRSDDAPGGASRPVLREDGRPLGPAHALHEDIRDLGRGRYSHWGATLHFSASDNSDPRRNGHQYTATDREIVSPQLVSTVLGADMIAGVALFGLAVAVGLRLGARNRTRVMATGSIALCVGVLGFALISPGLRHLLVLIAASASMLYGASRLLARSPWALVVAEPHPLSRPRCVGLRLQVAVVSVAAVFLYAGPVQIYPAPGWADPSIYHGYFVHYAFNLFLTGPTYFSERFAFVLPGMLLFRILPVDAAYYAMALLPTVVVALSLLSIGTGFAGRKVTVAILILTAANVLVIAPVGQGYISGIVLAALLAGYALLLRSAGQDRFGLATFGAGACFAVAVFTNPIALFYLQGGLIALLIVYPHFRRSWLARSGWGLAGSLVTLLAFALASKALTGSFDFLTPELKMSADAGDTPFKMPLARWLPHAIRLAYILILAACGILALLRCSPARAVQRRPAFLALCWAITSLLSAGGVLVAADVVLGNAFLMTWFYSCYFVIYTTVIAAAVLDLARPAHLSLRAKTALQLGCLLGGALAVAGALATQGVDPPRLHPIALAIFGGALTLACLWVSFGEGGRSRRLGVLPALVATLVPVVILDLNPDTRHVFVYDDPSFRDSTLLAAEADRYIFTNLHGRLPLFWYSPGAYTRATTRLRDWEFPYGGVYPLWFRGPRAYNLLDQIWCYYYTAPLQDHEDAEDIDRSTPDWVPVLTRPVPKAIVVLSRDPLDGWRAADRAAELFGADLVPEDHTLITRGTLAVHVWILAIRDPGHIKPRPFEPS